MENPLTQHTWILSMKISVDRNKEIHGSKILESRDASCSTRIFLQHNSLPKFAARYPSITVIPLQCHPQKSTTQLQDQTCRMRHQQRVKAMLYTNCLQGNCSYDKYLSMHKQKIQIEQGLVDTQLRESRPQLEFLGVEASQLQCTNEYWIQWFQKEHRNVLHFNNYYLFVVSDNKITTLVTVSPLYYFKV